MEIRDFIPSPVGFWPIEANSETITAIKFTAEKPLWTPNPSKITKQATQQLTQYFNNNLEEFDLPLNTLGYSPFYKSVWKAVSDIPFGKTASYSDLAITINNPKSVRAVGLANGKNPFPVVVPCHRIIGKDKSLTGYASGLKVKKWLLEREGTIAVQKTLF